MLEGSHCVTIEIKDGFCFEIKLFSVNKNSEFCFHLKILRSILSLYFVTLEDSDRMEKVWGESVHQLRALQDTVMLSPLYLIYGHITGSIVVNQSSDSTGTGTHLPALREKLSYQGCMQILMWRSLTVHATLTYGTVMHRPCDASVCDGHAQSTRR